MKKIPWRHKWDWRFTIISLPSVILREPHKMMQKKMGGMKYSSVLFAFSSKSISSLGISNRFHIINQPSHQQPATAHGVHIHSWKHASRALQQITQIAFWIWLQMSMTRGQEMIQDWNSMCGFRAYLKMRESITNVRQIFCKNVLLAIDWNISHCTSWAHLRKIQSRDCNTRHNMGI